MFIFMLILSLIGTVAAVFVTSYAAYITSKVSGEKLLTLNSELGYKYATTYHDWQMAAIIMVAIAVVIWIVFIFIAVKRWKKKKLIARTTQLGIRSNRI